MCFLIIGEAKSWVGCWGTAYGQFSCKSIEVPEYDWWVLYETVDP